MLVLARKLHQSILIGDTVRITVLEVRDGQVRLGIDAPREVSILREEAVHAAAASNRKACAGGAPTGKVVERVAALLLQCLSAEERGGGQ